MLKGRCESLATGSGRGVTLLFFFGFVLISYNSFMFCFSFILAKDAFSSIIIIMPFVVYFFGLRLGSRKICFRIIFPAF